MEIELNHLGTKVSRSATIGEGVVLGRGTVVGDGE